MSSIVCNAGPLIALAGIGLQVIGTARLLVEAKRASLIPAVLPLLLRMRDNGYWISDKIIAEIRRQAGE